MGDGGIVGYEPSAEIGEAEEGSSILDFSRGWPGSNAIKFDWVHGKLSWFYNHIKIFNFRNIELTFFKF